MLQIYVAMMYKKERKRKSGKNLVSSEERNLEVRKYGSRKQKCLEPDGSREGARIFVKIRTTYLANGTE